MSCCDENCDCKKTLTPCQSCGRCPVCGRGGAGTWVPNTPSVTPYPYLYNPTVWYASSTSTGNLTFTVS